MKQEYKLLSSGANGDSCVKCVLLNREIGRYKNSSIILVKECVWFFKSPCRNILKEVFHGKAFGIVEGVMGSNPAAFPGQK